MVRLTGLDTLRAIAIVHVVLAHGAMAFMPDLPGISGHVVWLLIATNFGVPLFFVLSGFLITRQLASGIPVTTFYRHRLAKIYPMFVLAVIVFGWLNGVTDARVWLLHLTALHNGSASISSGMSGHLWSLAVEIQFYALAPMLFWAAYRWLRPRSIAALAVVVWIGHAAYLLGAPPTQEARLAALLNVYQFTSFNIVALLMGAMLYRAQAEGQAWRGALPLGLVAALAMPLICMLVIPSLRADQADLTQTASVLALLTLITLPPVASVCLAYLTLRRNWFSGPRWRPVAAFIAAISYQWYLWHPLVLLGTHRLATRSPEVGAWMQSRPWLTLLGYVVSSALLGWLSFRWLERPLHRWLLSRPKRDKGLTKQPTSG
ncbi:acyltransferase family protein [Ottowia flava]|uniref:Acyltransferase family protein n=1 Tax=Ottowia flava TaxID=2675430 RepID=A0ABW4KNF3_9BURK|nr:acyltransferase [Ottowia sp. GY511]